MSLAANSYSTDEDLLWAMVRAYHGWKDDNEMIEVVGYNLEIYVERMRDAVKVLENKHTATGSGS